MNFTKMTKLGLAAMMAMSLAACSSSDTGTTSGSTASESTTAAFKLGGSGPITGDAAVYGISIQQGAELAISEINAKGGVQFEFNFQDDQASGEMATTAFNTLMDWDMQISLATVTSGAGQAVSPLYAEENIFGITPSGSSAAVVFQDADNLTDPYGTIFQMCFTDPNQGYASADYFAEHTELGTKIGIIYRNDDNYSSGIYTKFVERAEANGLTIVETQTFTGDATDFSVQVQKCKDAGADLVFLPIYYQPASQILAEAQKQEYTPSFFGCDGLDGLLSMEGFDKTLAEGTFMLTPYSADSTEETSAHFTAAYEETYGETPTQFAADAYDAVYAIAQAIEASGITPDASTDEITAAMIEQFTSMTFNGVTGQNVTWSSTGEVSKAPMAVMVQDGTYVSYGD